MNSQMKPGTIVDNRFRIVKILGKGGQGTIYLVEDTINDNARRALKTLRKEILPKNLGRMQREVLALKGIKSEFVLSMEATNLDTYQLDSEEVPYFVTEFAEYGTLRKHNYFNGEIDLSLRLFRDICEGVLAVHAAGIIHRDLKPSNVLLVENEKDVRVGDFGLCYIDLEEDKERATSIREKVGPLFFAAPEQTSLPPNFTKRSDIYSLGRILDFMITGAYEFVPGDEYNPVTVRLGMKKSHPVDTLISKSTSFDPGNRPASVENVIEEIDKLLGIEPEEEPTLELSKMQERILKYIRSYSPASVSLGKILDYLVNFYNVARGSLPRAVNFTGRLNWQEFVDRVENSLEQLEEAELVTFERGEYSAW
jgi:serine/threonine protein kinase